MKVKRFVAYPVMLIVFLTIICLSIAGLVVFIVYTQLQPLNDAVFTVFVSVLLACMAASMFVVGYTTGAFDVIVVREEEVIILRFAKKLRRYLLSQNTQLYVQKGFRGSRYIEIRFPEYFESEPQIYKGIRVREGYVCMTHTNARIKYVREVLQNYKENINPLSLSVEWQIDVTESDGESNSFFG